MGHLYESTAVIVYSRCLSHSREVLLVGKLSACVVEIRESDPLSSLSVRTSWNQLNANIFKVGRLTDSAMSMTRPDFRGDLRVSAESG